MSGTMYRRARPTLQDLMELGGDGGGGGGMQSGIDPTQGGGDSQLLQQLLSQAFAPQDLGPRPETYKPKIGSKIAAALGDALSSYGKAFAPIPGTNYQAELRGRTQDSEDKQARYDSAKALSGSNSGREKARFQLGELDRKQRESDAAKAKAEESAWRKTQAEQHAAELADARAQAKALNDADNATRIAVEKMGNDNRMALAGAEARLHSDRAKGEGDKAQHAEYVAAKGAIIGKKREYEQALAEGKITPEQIIAEWSDIRDASDLDPNGPYAAAADAFFKDKIGPLLMKYGQQQGPVPNAAPGPSAQDIIIQQGTAPVVGAIKNMVRPFGRGGVKPEGSW